MPPSPGLAPQMPKLLFVSKYFDHILYFFLHVLAKHWHLTLVVNLENEWSDRLDADGFELHRLVPKSRFDSAYQREIETLYRAGPWDLIQCFHGNSEITNLVRWNRRRLPLVGYRARIGHLSIWENPTAYWHVRNPSLFGVAAVSTAVEKYLQSFAFFRARNVRVIHHGIDRAWVASQCEKPFGLRGKLGIPGDALIVASIAALRPVKRFEYVAHAAERLADHPIHFVHIGAPNGWDEKVSHLPKIHFVGHQDAPLPILAEADLFAMTSHNEAFGRANIEAMACGIAVIGSNTGGFLDIVEPGVTGQLFDTGDPDDFTAKIELYCSNRELVYEHGRNAKARVDAHFNTARMAAEYLAFYDDAVAAARR
ncbi:MAG: glycosyltransferase family 4 protein [Gammaproteobacteria bacterium]|nr:glycosyltransferase family 4 protein [Gammaproteobacteria bacterium]